MRMVKKVNKRKEKWYLLRQWNAIPSTDTSCAKDKVPKQEENDRQFIAARWKPVLRGYDQ